MHCAARFGKVARILTFSLNLIRLRRFELGGFEISVYVNIYRGDWQFNHRKARAGRIVIRSAAKAIAHLSDAAVCRFGANCSDDH